MRITCYRAKKREKKKRSGLSRGREKEEENLDFFSCCAIRRPISRVTRPVARSLASHDLSPAGDFCSLRSEKKRLPSWGERMRRHRRRSRAISSPHAGRRNISPRGENERGDVVVARFVACERFLLLGAGRRNVSQRGENERGDKATSAILYYELCLIMNYYLQAYVDSSVITGQTGLFQKDIEKYGNIEYMRCVPENDFFPDLSTISQADVIFFCSPNNPTGSAATREQLTHLVQFAKNHGSIIVYDSAYAMYISDDSPRTIFEIPGAKEVSLFLPKLFLDRVFVTSQAMSETINFYKENTEIIVDTFRSLGFNVYGGKNAPYVWVQFPGRSSWDVFAEILEKAHVVTTPGSGFGPGGENFIRVSAFGHRANILEAAKRIKQLYK
ncbi:hypothetical protein B296_00024954 [Ensete ventricosum]|uniref:Aminotransferase class I/classII large domain-containing protein n=1 Tax=Ensete ventricosum TaxID=4639 RepID=A0A426XQG4_ENSVE|nr:hypothetical protein B296_00024954 [Ensete ventricosum]